MDIVSRQTLQKIGERPDNGEPAMWLPCTYSGAIGPDDGRIHLKLHRRKGFGNADTWMPATLDDDLLVRKQLAFEQANGVASIPA